MPKPIPYTERRGRDLWELVCEFIDEQRISCAEAVYQSDRVIQNAYEFIEALGYVVGWYDGEQEGA